MTVRVGLVGTGTWAREVHAPGLATAPGVELAGVWGRAAEARHALASEFGVVAFSELQEMFESVDAVSFAVPPVVQVECAPRAAASGCALLLEKPLSTELPGAARIASAVHDGGVEAVVFTTRLFDPVRLTWLRERAAEAWGSAHVEFVSSALSTGRFRHSEWRQRWGALWDVGPHVISQLEVLFGAIQAVSVEECVVKGPVRLRFVLERGTATAHLNVHADVPQLQEGVRLGDLSQGVSSPPAGVSPVEAYRLAVSELVMPSGDPALRPASVDAGVATVQTLTMLQQLMESGRLGVLTKLPPLEVRR
ncbi:Gfo/Idh/MocA family protein [Pedococcus sp. 5OH_020]|uniref:Gfo/Idh/MocA family protein n=1 Tax=Pedococcus sp. 5OH_020 TaxID=2989814 RepID=UPI0022E9C9A4|nr:Gfo/Idh/MocA family oxidoreductase [Pedococcus sp. 5OH_020]